MTVQTAYLIDEDLKRQFKILCARRGVSMSGEINKFIRTTLEDNPLGEKFWSTPTRPRALLGNPEVHDWRDEMIGRDWESTY